MMSDGVAAADDEAGSDSDETRSNEDDDDYDDDDDGDYEDEPGGGGGSKIMPWVQRVYESGSTLVKYMLSCSLLGIILHPPPLTPTPTPHAELLHPPLAVSDWSSSSGTRRARNKSCSSAASSRRLPS